ncbi:hypothetical protein IAU60_000645 [Kwoniella sp. DSM 27419]
MVLLLIALLPLLPSALGGLYSLSRSWTGDQFFDGFNWMTFDDPTKGRSNYVDLATARAEGLSYASGDTFTIRVDTYNVVDASSRGRDSVRMHSKETFGDGLLVTDVSHIPTGCAVWPAVWTNSRAGPWPAGGEVDIVEGLYGINENYSNDLFSLHTTAECRMPQNHSRGEGRVGNLDCRGGTGCGVYGRGRKSFGVNFNNQGGGVFVMRRSMTIGFAFWFFSRGDTIPEGLSSGANSLNEADLGPPLANFPNYNCDFPKYFDQHEIIINIALSGGWAGGPPWNGSKCAGDVGWTADNFVDKNPQAFTDAYWDLKGMRWYEESAAAPSTTPRCKRQKRVVESVRAE